MSDRTIEDKLEQVEEHFIRLRLSIAYIREIYEYVEGQWLIREGYCSNTVRVAGSELELFFRHVDSTVQRDCATAISALLDTSNTTNSLVKLVKSPDLKAFKRKVEELERSDERKCLKTLRDTSIAHISRDNTQTNATISDILVLYEKLEEVWKKILGSYPNHQISAPKSYHAHAKAFWTTALRRGG